MRRLYGFSNWLIESILQEATLRFSAKHLNQDANIVPAGFWRWVQEKMGENPKWIPAIDGDDGRRMNRDEVMALINTRASNKPYGGGRPAAPVQPREEPKPEALTKPLSKEPWILATVINVEGLQKGEHVVVTKGADGSWVAMTRNGATKRIPAAEVRTSIASIRKNDKPLTSEDPEQLWAMIPNSPAESKPDEQVGGVNPHVLDQGKLSEEQKEIDRDFEQMMVSPRQNHMMINALAGTGKAQPLDSLLLTPNGWIKMGDVSIGDKVFGSDGKPHEITGVFPQGTKEVFELKFTDGSTVECCEDHLWFTETKRNRDKSRYQKKALFSNAKVCSTKDIRETLIYKNRPNHYIPLAQPLQFPNKKTPIDPYVMGVLLGDWSFRTGCVSYSTKDAEIVESVNSSITPLTSRHSSRCDYRIVGSGRGVDNPLVVEVKKAGLWNKLSHEKSIPDIYKFNSVQVRTDILQGLLDTDGDVGLKTSNVEYNTTSKQLYEDVKYLVESLGGVVSTSFRRTKYTHKDIKKTGRLSYRLNIKLPVDVIPFRLSRKKNAYTVRQKYFPRRAIKSITSIGNKECQCISVNSPDSLYMTNHCVLTHNTTILKHLAWKYGKEGQNWLYLVFNAKNRAEAKDYSGGFRKFPEWVEIYTTNSFLGHVIGDKENRGKIPATERLLSLQRGEEDGGGGGENKLEKARIIVDGPVFAKLMTNTYHLPDWDQVENDVPDIMNRLGVRPEKSRPGSKKTFYEVCLSTLEYTIDSIRYNFKERVLTLLGLLKSFAVDPRKKDTLQQEVRRVFDKYDVAQHEDGEKEEGFFDTHLEDIKERIDNYKPRFRDLILDALYEILHYDFMGKTYKEEVIGAATWMLEKALPKGTDERYVRKNEQGQPQGRPVNLGDYRDFNDDIWFPTIYSDKLKWPHYDVVLADEVQDFNEGQKIMLKKLAEAGAKIVAVGDPNQGIYRFRGADNSAFDNLASMLHEKSTDKHGWKPKSLSYNFRSRPEVLQYSNEHTHVKDLKSGKKFKDGELEPMVTHEKLNYDDSFEMIGKERQAGKMIETAYISRTNQPLVNAALKLLGQGVPFAIIGKDVTGDLVKHIKKIIGKERERGMNDNTSALLFRDALLNFEDSEKRNKGKYSTQKSRLANLKDTTLAITASIDKFTENGKKDGTIREFKRWLTEKLGSNSFDWDQSDEEKSEADLKAYKEKLEKEKPVILTTAHKSKGLEFARVFILRNDQFPHPKAKHPEEIGQENNAKYVAFTRAMHQLHNLDPKGQPGYKKDDSNPSDEDYED